MFTKGCGFVLEIIKASDGREIYLNKWLPEGEVRAVVVLLHGMAEYSGRYAEFAQYLNEAGIALYCHDQRGHGLTGQAAGDLGHLIPHWGWHMMVDDGCRILQLAKAEWEVPVYLMGHSMGSFLARVLTQQNPHLMAGLILSGTGSNPQAMVKTGRQTAAVMCRLQGAEHPSPLLQNITFGAFNSKFKNHKTAYDWICRDEEVVQAYIDDGFCGLTCTNGFYYELYDVNLAANQLANDKRLPSQLPILIFSGDHDPVGDMGEGVRKVCANYRALGIEDVTCRLYPGGRHEMLNELNKAEVFADVRQWLLDHLA